MRSRLLPLTSTFQAFRAERKTVYAVVRALEIISEASRRLPDELLRRHPEIDWAAIAAAGNVYLKRPNHGRIGTQSAFTADCLQVRNDRLARDTLVSCDSAED